MQDDIYNEMLKKCSEFFFRTHTKTAYTAAAKAFKDFYDSRPKKILVVQYAYDSDEYRQAYDAFVEMQFHKHNNILTVPEQNAQQRYIRKYLPDEPTAIANIEYWTANGDKRIYVANLPTIPKKIDQQQQQSQQLYSPTDYEQYKAQRKADVEGQAA